MDISLCEQQPSHRQSVHHFTPSTRKTSAKSERGVGWIGDHLANNFHEHMVGRVLHVTMAPPANNVEKKWKLLCTYTHTHTNISPRCCKTAVRLSHFHTNELLRGINCRPKLLGVLPSFQKPYPNPSLLHEEVPPDVCVCVKVNQIKLLSVWVQLLLLGLMCKLETFCPTNLNPPFESCIFIKSSESVNQEGPEDSPSKSWSPKRQLLAEKLCCSGGWPRYTWWMSS